MRLVSNQTPIILLTSELPQSIRSVRTKYEENGYYISIWVSENWGEYSNYLVNLGTELKIELGASLCKICHTHTEDLFRGLCNTCTTYEQDYLLRLYCLFNRSDSFYNQYSCTRDDPTCNSEENKKLCYKPYILYMGRIGNFIKIGIARKSRTGSYLSRLYEQGLNEAIVVDSFSSLPEVLTVENEFRAMGFSDRIQFRQKITAITTQDHIDLLDFWPLSMWEDLFPNKKIAHPTLVPDTYISHSIVEGTPEHILGKVEYIQGPLLITSVDDQYYCWNTTEMQDREILSIKVS